MKKIKLTSAIAILFFNVAVFAEPHLDEAIKHASAAGQANDAASISEHTVSALEHAMAGSLIAKGAARTHADEGVKALENALASAKAKKTDNAKSSISSALEHLKAANKK